MIYLSSGFSLNDLDEKLKEKSILTSKTIPRSINTDEVTSRRYLLSSKYAMDVVPQVCDNLKANPLQWEICLCLVSLTGSDSKDKALITERDFGQQ